MWFGSYNGLTRYDGNNFQYFNIDKEFPYKIENNQIRDLYVDEKGLLYIGFNYHGFAIYDPISGNFKYFRNSPDSTKNSLISDKIFSLSPAANGKIWIATKMGLDLFDPLTESFTHFEIPAPAGQALLNKGVSSVTDDKNGELWIYTLNNTLIRYRASDETFKYYSLPSLSGNTPLLNRGGVLYKDSRNQIWVGTEYAGLYTLNPESGAIKAYKHTRLDRPYKVVMDIMEDEENGIWVATDGDGIIKFSGENDSREELIHDPFKSHSISTNAVYCLYNSKPGIVWAGVYAGGVNIFKKKKRKFYSYSDVGTPGKRLSNKSILCFSASPDGKILMGTDGGGLNIFYPEQKTFSYKSAETGYCFNIVKSLLKDSKGRIWAGSFGEGACLLEESSQKRIESSKLNLSDHLNHPSVWSIEESADGKIWMGLLNNGIDILDPNTSAIKHLTPAILGITLGNVYSIIRDSKNRIWVTSEESCLLLFNPENQSFISFNPDNTKGFTSIFANVVMEDSHGNIWIGFENGGVSKLEDINKKESKNISVKDGLPGSSVNGILEDKNGIMWFATDNGLASYNPVTEEIRTFSQEDGLVGMEFNKGATFKDKNDYLYFGSGEGLVYFHPDSLWYNPYKPSTFLTSIKIINREISRHDNRKYITKNIPFADNLTITHEDDIVSFEFSTLDYLIPEKNLYAYMLEGFDDDWVYVNADRRYATYTTLPPGKYRFLVKASNNDGLWNNEPAALTITVLPPWWKTSWFKAITFILISSFIGGIMYMRIRMEKAQRNLLESLVEKRTEQLNQSNATKDKLFSIVAHDLKGPVNSMKGLASMLENHYGKLSEDDVKEAVGHISKSAKTLSELVNNLFSWARLHTNKLVPVKQIFPVAPVIERILETYRIPASEKEINICFNKAASDVQVYADPNMYETVIRNLVNNAIKFTEKGGSILISCQQKNEWTATIVKDSGIGMDQETVKKIFNTSETRTGTQGEAGTGLGLTICYDFIQANDGSISVRSSKGEGTEFEVNLKNSE